MVTREAPPSGGVPEPAPPSRSPSSRRTRRILIGVGATLLVIVLGIAATIYFVTETLGNNVTRVPGVFQGLPADRPADTGALTFLLVGTDSRATEATTGSDAPAGVNAGSQRSDVIMLAQIAPNRSQASIVSIPRDSWVDIPGRGKNKINAAYAFGGPSLLIETVENMTKVRVDHFAVIDFSGFQNMVDSVGGIDVRVAKTTSTFGGYTFHEGLNHLDGAAALAYVRQRYELPRGDLDRAARQQNALKALLSKAVENGSFANVGALYDLADATTKTVSVDDTLTNNGLRGLAFDLRELRPAGVTFLTTPVRGLGMEGAQSVVYLDDTAASALWAALRDGQLQTYLQTHPADTLASVPA
ncbi:LCP family protein [Pseudonocardia sp.]|uniref:LCP family protein n=1 Tax=Pseudonocardia sp. TaxID=60912 RepID=UPI003D0E68D4